MCVCSVGCASVICCGFRSGRSVSIGVVGMSVDVGVSAGVGASVEWV